MSERLIPQCPTAHALAQDGSCGFTWLCQCQLPTAAAAAAKDVYDWTYLFVPCLLAWSFVEVDDDDGVKV